MPSTALRDLLSIGDVAARAGLSVATVRYYEARGLIDAVRSANGQRRFRRLTLRRLAVIAAGQRIGLSLQEIADALSGLPRDKPPTQADWTRMSERWAKLVAERIRVLQQLASDLDGCIGCGCLSLAKCVLFNPDDIASAEGPGSRWLRATD